MIPAGVLGVARREPAGGSETVIWSDGFNGSLPWTGGSTTTVIDTGGGAKEGAGFLNADRHAYGNAYVSGLSATMPFVIRGWVRQIAGTKMVGFRADDGGGKVHQGYLDHRSGRGLSYRWNNSSGSATEEGNPLAAGVWLYLEVEFIDASTLNLRVSDDSLTLLHSFSPTFSAASTTLTDIGVYHYSTGMDWDLMEVVEL